MSYFIKQIYKKEDASLKKAVFLDRDGVLIDNVSYLSDPSQIHLLPGVAQGIKKFNAENSILIVVTNQPVVSRGLATIEKVKAINNSLVAILNQKRAYINAVYFCPHHPERHHPDIPPKAMKYRIECECRKPNLAMLENAVEDFNINKAKAFMIGDRASDIKAGEKLGLTTILIGENTYSVKPDYVVSDFSQAVDIICRQ